MDPTSSAVFDELVLRYEGCYGSCPQYEVEVRRGGAARWVGMAHTPREGTFVGEIDVQDYARLCRAAETADLTRLEASYWTREMHGPTVVVEWVQGDRKGTIRVEGEGGGPEDFRAFRALFDELASTIQWRPVGESRSGG